MVGFNNPIPRGIQRQQIVCFGGQSMGKLWMTLWWVLIIVCHTIGFIYIHKIHASSQERRWRAGMDFKWLRQPWRHMCAERQFHGHWRGKWCTTLGWCLMMDEHVLGFLCVLGKHANNQERREKAGLHSQWHEQPQRWMQCGNWFQLEFKGRETRPLNGSYHHWKYMIRIDRGVFKRGIVVPGKGGHKINNHQV